MKPVLANSVPPRPYSAGVTTL